MSTKSTRSFCQKLVWQKNSGGSSIQCNLEANLFVSSIFCQPLFEGNFTITPEWVTRPKLCSGMTTVKINYRQVYWLTLHGDVLLSASFDPKCKNSSSGMNLFNIFNSSFSKSFLSSTMEAPGTLNTFKHSAYPVSTNLEANFRLESLANKTQGKAIIIFLDGIFDFRFWDITECGWMRQSYMIIKSLTTHNSQ